MAKSTEVLVYGLKDLNPGDPAALAAEYGIQFRFFPATWFDRLLFNLRRVLQYFSWDAIAEGLRNRYEAIPKPVVNLV